MDAGKTCAINIIGHDAMDVGDIFRTIYSSCDVDSTGLVPVTNLIEFIKPYLLEDLTALEDLQHALDPTGANALVSSERFYEVMNQWSQKVATASSGEDTDFDRSPNMLAPIDDKDLPYTHSTPRASLGEKLLRCKDLLNLSNVSGYSLSTSRLEHAEPDKTVLEEEIKKLEHQLLKTTNELCMVKQQLAVSEDQNDQLQQDLDRVNRRLNAEQQVNEHLQKDIKYSEELRDELNNFKKTVEELKKKLSQSEKDSLYHKNMVNEMEQEKAKLEKKIEILSRQHQDCLKELFDIKTELEAKDEQMNEISKVYSELKSKFSEQKDFIDQLREENDLLNHQKSTLEKAMKAKPPNSPHSNLGKLLLDLSKTPSPPSTFNTSSPYQSNSQLHQPKTQSLPLLRRVLSRHSSTPITEEKSLLDASPPDNFKSVPVLSPIKTVALGDHNQKQDSSEEDLYWKMQQGDVRSNGLDMNGTTESLDTEMRKADPLKINDAYPTFIYEKEERIAELEHEIVTLKSYIGGIEDRNNEFVSKLREQEKRNVELLENNFVLARKEESAHTKIESLTQRIAQMEQNGSIVENQQEDIGGMRHRIQILEVAVQEKDTALKNAMETIRSLQKDTAELQEELVDYDEQLQTAMRDLGELTVEKMSVQEKIDSLQMKLSAAEEKVKELESCNANISQRNKELEEENFIAKHDLECSRTKCENLTQRISAMDKEFRALQIIEKQKSEELANHQQQKAKLEIEVKDFKENLEKKLVAEFEAKVKYSMDAQETIMQLNQKCNNQEDKLTGLLEKLGNESRMLCQAETRITLLTNENERLQKEVDCLNAAKTDLEIEITQLKTEHAKTAATIGNLDLVAADIQTHIISKNSVIEELKKLNRSLETNLNRAQLEIRKKVDDILEMRNQLTKELDIKNDLWKKARTLEKELHTKIIEINQLTEHHQTLLDSNNELKIEYNNLLIVYDLEVNKNGKLVKHVAQCNEEKDQCYRKYNELEMELKNTIEKNQNLSKFVSDCERKMSDLETCNKELKEQISHVSTKDSTSQTITNDLLDAEEAFAKIKLESDQLLEELEMKLNQESMKNRSLTANLLEMKNNYAQNNAELELMKQKLTDNEVEISLKLQENYEKYNLLVEELKDSKEMLNMHVSELSKIKNELEESKDSLKVETEKNVKINEELKYTVAKYNKLLEELDETKSDLTAKHNEKIKIEIELSHTKDSLEAANEENRALVHELDKKGEMLKDYTEKYDLMLQELSEAKDTIDKNDNNIQKLASEMKQMTAKLKDESERNRVLSLQLEDESNNLQEARQQLNATEEYFEKISRELFEDIEKLHAQLKEKDEEIISLKKSHKLLKETLDTIQQKNNQLIFDLKQELSVAKDEKQKLAHKLCEVETESVTLSQQLEEIENINKVLQNEKDELVAKANLTKQEKDNLNKELLLLKQNLTETKKEKNSVFTNTNQRLQEELAKNKALFENFLTLKKERDNLIFDLKETQSLLENSQILCSKRQNELLDFQAKHSLLETKLSDQAKQLEKLELLLDKTRSEMSVIIQDRDELKSQLTNMQILLNESKMAEKEKSDSRGKTYSRQQITIDKLKDKIEDLENKLSAEKDKNQQLNNRLILVDDKVVGTGNDLATEQLEKLIKQIADKEITCKALVDRRDEISLEIATLEEKLEAVRKELETLDWRLENKQQPVEDDVELRSTEDVGIQVDASESFKDKREGRSIGKFTLASRSESPDSPSTGIDSGGLTNLKGSCIVKSPYSVHCDSVLEIPSLDVSGFADDIIEELELGDSSPRKKLDREELEKKVTALTLRLVANDNSISERIEQQTEKYRCQYEAILTLVRDISHRLRDHVCIGTAEPIVPVYVLLEEVKLRMKELVQNAGQVGVLICENRMKRCWNLTVNYMAMLRQDNEVLHNISRDTTPTQTGQIGRRNQYTQEKTGPPKDKRQRRKLYARCAKFCGSVLFVIALAMAVSLAINLTCATENQYCPLDLIVQRINVGLPPM